MTYVNPEPEYAIRAMGPRLWQVWKIDGHHMKSITMYEVKQLGDRFYCSCIAKGDCKHLGMVREYRAEATKPKKDLF